MTDPWCAGWHLPIRGLVLDIDDTLLDTRTAMLAACHVAAAQAWPGEPAATHRRIADVVYADPGGWFDRYTRGEVDFEAMRRARYAAAVADAGLGDERFEVFEPVYRDRLVDEQILFDDAHALFDRAARDDVAICLLTNSSRAQTERKLAAVGLADRFDVVTTDLLGVGKPDPRTFAAARTALGTGRQETVCVGDTLPTDVVGGRAAGLRVAWLQRPGLPPPRDSGWGTPVDDPGVRVVPTLTAVADLF